MSKNQVLKTVTRTIEVAFHQRFTSRGEGSRRIHHLHLRVILRALTCLLSAGWPLACPASDADEVVIVYNKREHGSEEIARHYAERRGVPENQILGLRMPVTEMINRWQFAEEVQTPIAEYLEQQKLWVLGEVPLEGTNSASVETRTKVVQSKIRYLILCRGVPLKIAGDPELLERGGEETRPEFRRNEAAVDSELMCLPMLRGGYQVSGPLSNPLYAVTNAADISPTNGILMVSRLDGPTVKVANGLVDKAMEAETNGFWGRAYFDLRSPSDPGMKQGEDWLRSAAEVCRLLGFETVVDTNAATLKRGFPMSQVAVYAGWYAGNVNGPFLDEPVEFMPGALAYHLHSFSAASLRTTDTYWVGPLLERGATLSLGCVHEPYLGGTPDIGVLAVRLYYMGFSYGEAACASQPVISWMTTVVGDPLFKPFLIPPQEIHTELIARDDPLAEWSQLRVVNLNIARGFPKAQMVTYLEEIPRTERSAVLTEKLADLYSELGKPASALRSWQAALGLNPSRQQRIRLQLTLGEKLAEAGEDKEALAMYQQLLNDDPAYPDAISVYRRMATLSEKLGDASQTLQFQEKIKQLSGA